jgi:hypothetical protein
MQNLIDKLLPKAPEGVIDAFVAELKSDPTITTMVIPHGVSMEEYIENHLDPLWWIAQN